jgi:gamma-glutamyl-gamma-aminobutyrate hydrolase PuuD
LRIVAVSQRIDHYPDRNETRDAIDHRLIALLMLAGYIPVQVPNGLCKILPDGRSDNTGLDLWLAIVKPQAFVLSGGSDIGQSDDRDLTEGFLLQHASRYQKPLLGICRGMQMMAIWAGVDLCPIQGHVRIRHQLSGEIAVEVNSYHNFALASCPVDFEVLATSEDGAIEAIRHKFLAWEGWMWHPEREEYFSSYDLQRIRTLFDG